MTSFLTVTIQGLPELQKALSELSSRVERRYVYVATAAAAGTMKNAVIAAAPVYHGEVSEGHPPPGTLKKSISIGRAKGLGRGWVGYYVYVKSGKKSKHDAYYWRWVEFGHFTKGSKRFKYRAGNGRTFSARRAEESGAKFIPPQSFMRSAFDANWQASLDRFVNKLGGLLLTDLR